MGDQCFGDVVCLWCGFGDDVQKIVFVYDGDQVGYICN